MADTKTSDETAASALTGAELVRIVQSSNNRRTTTQDIADLGAGMFRGALSALPTDANLPFTTWQNQGTATVTDTDAGVSFFKASHAGDSNSLYYLAAPATPYSYTALVALTTSEISGAGRNGAIALGWSDGTKYQFIALKLDTGNIKLFVQRYSNSTTFVSNDYSGTIISRFAWLKIADDGTNVTFSYSSDGINFVTAYTVAKASGYLGASGYSNVGVIISAAGADTYGMLMSFTAGS